jgi:hypothetical protein
MNVNHRSPGRTQQTSLRINALLRDHLSRGGRVDLATATRATVHTTQTQTQTQQTLAAAGELRRDLQREVT